MYIHSFFLILPGHHSQSVDLMKEDFNRLQHKLIIWGKKKYNQRIDTLFPKVQRDQP